MLDIKIPASTSNLGAGFDVFGLALRLYLKVKVEKLPGSNKEFRFTGEGSTSITASASNNFIISALKQVFENRSMKAPGYRIRVHNSIPVSRGLGSSGTAIIAGVIAANYLGDLDMSNNEILSEAVHIEGHPDNICPSFAGGLTAALQVNNSEIKYLKQRFPADVIPVFIIPNFHVMTKKARKILPKKYLMKDVRFNLQRVSLLLESVRRRDYALLSYVLQDRLHQPYRAQLVPGMENVLKMESEKGLIGIYISGSGPTVCAFTTSNADIIGSKIVRIFSKDNLAARVLVLKADNKGTRTVHKG